MINLKNPFPLDSRLIHCITNEITCKMLANAILALGCKPVMADDPREVLEFTKQSSALLINLGHLSSEKELAIRKATTFANHLPIPIIVDAVGVTTSSIRKSLVKDILKISPCVVKGNMSEIRSLMDLKHHGIGVDANHKDQTIKDLIPILKNWCQQYPNTCFLVTGPSDLVISSEKVAILNNGCPSLDWITGTGDLVGAFTAVFLSQNLKAFEAATLAISYLNISAEKAIEKSIGLEDFYFQTTNQLSLLKLDKNWLSTIKGEINDYRIT